MNKEQKNTVVNETDPGSENAALNEKDLENVSGGFELPTIIDFCKNELVYNVCVNAPWGSCKHFSRVYVKKEEGILQTSFHYTGSCAKGCFKDVPYQEFM